MYVHRAGTCKIFQSPRPVQASGIFSMHICTSPNSSRGNKSWCENGRKRAQYVAIRGSRRSNDSSMLSLRLFSFYLCSDWLKWHSLTMCPASLLTSATLATAAAASRRAASTFIYKENSLSLSFFSGKREKRRDGCVSYYYFAALPDKSCVPARAYDIWPHSLRLSKLIETWTGPTREVMLILEDSIWTSFCWYREATCNQMEQSDIHLIVCSQCSRNFGWMIAAQQFRK